MNVFIYVYVCNIFCQLSHTYTIEIFWTHKWPYSHEERYDHQSQDLNGMDYIRAWRLMNTAIQIKDKDVHLSTDSTKHTKLVKEPSTTSTVKCAFLFAKTTKTRRNSWFWAEHQSPVEEGRVRVELQRGKWVVILIAAGTSRMWRNHVFSLRWHHHPQKKRNHYIILTFFPT